MCSNTEWVRTSRLGVGSFILSNNILNDHSSRSCSVDEPDIDETLGLARCDIRINMDTPLLIL